MRVQPDIQLLYSNYYNRMTDLGKCLYLTNIFFILMRIQRYLVLILPLFMLFTANTSAEMMMMYHPPRQIYSPYTGDMWYGDLYTLMYEKGTTGHNLEWQFEADELNDDPWTYTAKIDGEILPGHNQTHWLDFTPIIVNIDGLDLGNYMVYIQVNDSHTLFNQAAPFEKYYPLEVVLEMPEETMETTTVVDSSNTFQNTNNTSEVITYFVRDGYPTRSMAITAVFFIIFLIVRGARVKVSMKL